MLTRHLFAPTLWNRNSVAAGHAASAGPRNQCTPRSPPDRSAARRGTCWWPCCAAGRRGRRLVVQLGAVRAGARRHPAALRRQADHQVPRRRGSTCDATSAPTSTSASKTCATPGKAQDTPPAIADDLHRDKHRRAKLARLTQERDELKESERFARVARVLEVETSSSGKRRQAGRQSPPPAPADALPLVAIPLQLPSTWNSRPTTTSPVPTPATTPPSVPTPMPVPTATARITPHRNGSRSSEPGLPTFFVVTIPFLPALHGRSSCSVWTVGPDEIHCDGIGGRFQAIRVITVGRGLSHGR